MVARPTRAARINPEASAGDAPYFDQYLFAGWYANALGIGTNAITAYRYETYGTRTPAVAVYNGPVGDQFVVVELAMSATQSRLFLNGKLVRTGLGNAYTRPLTAMGGNGFEHWFQGLVAEVVMYDGVLTPCERDRIEAYLSGKYALSDHDRPLTVSDAPAASASGGTVITDGQAVFYTPPFGFVGVDTLTYLVEDGCGGQDVGEVTVTVSAAHYAIEATAGSGGRIEPNGTTTILSGDSQMFSITPETGYKVQDVLVDGVSIGAVREYQFESVTEHHTIEARFNMLAVDDAFTVAQDSRNNRLDVLANDGREYDAPTPGMVFWLNAETLLADHADGDPVAEWPDLSEHLMNGERVVAQQGTPASQPLLIKEAINGHPAVRFDGENDWLQWAEGLAAQTYTLFVVARPFEEHAIDAESYLAAVSEQTKWLFRGDHSVSLGTNGISVYEVGVRHHYGNLWSTYDVASAGIYPARLGSQFLLLGLEFTDGQPGIWVNGALKHVGLNGNPEFLEKAPIIMGGGHDGTNHAFFGDVAEVLVYNRLLPNCERAQVEIYLKNKYGRPYAGSAFTLQQVAPLPPAAGTADIDGSAIIYTPAAGFTGIEHFTYLLDDGCDGLDSGQITIDVSAAYRSIEPMSGSGGRLETAETVTLLSGGEQVFAIVPDIGYEIQDVLVDGPSVGKVATYRFENVSANHTILAFFRKTGDDALVVRKNSVLNPIAPFANDFLTTPAPAEGLRFWLDASSLTDLQDVVPVALWPDRDDQYPFIDAAQTDPLKQPVLRAHALNGRPALEFDGLDDHLRWQEDQPQSFTVFAVYQTGVEQTMLPELLTQSAGMSAPTKHFLLDGTDAGSAAPSVGINGLIVYANYDQNRLPALTVYDHTVGDAPVLLRWEHVANISTIFLNGDLKRVGLSDWGSILPHVWGSMGRKPSTACWQKFWCTTGNYRAAQPDRSRAIWPANMACRWHTPMSPSASTVQHQPNTGR